MTKKKKKRKEKTSSIFSEHEEQYRNLVERANDGILIIQDKRVVYANPKLSEIVGYSNKALVGSLFTKYLHASELKKVAKRYAHRIAGKKVSPIYESVLKKKDGSPIHVEINAGIISYDGKPADLVFIRDIEKRKELDKEITESEKRYHTLFQKSIDAIFIHDIKGNIVDANQQASKLFGYTLKEFLSKSIPAMHPKHSLSISRKAFRDVKKKGNVKFVCDFRKKDGVIFPAEVFANAFTVGDKVLIQGIVRDITERKKAEDDIRKSESKLRGFFNSMNDMVFGHDKDGRFNLYHAPEKFLLYAPPKKFLGKLPKEVLPPYIVKMIASALKKNRKGLIAEFEYPLELKGRTYWFMAKMSPVFEDGKFNGSVSVVRNITLRKEVEQIKEDQYSELKKIDDLKSNILRDVSHELKTPAALITLSTKTISDELKKTSHDLEVIRKYADIADRNSRLFKKHIDSIVVLSRLQDTKNIKKKRIALHPLVSEIIKQLEPLADRKDIKIVDNVKKGYYLHANAVQLRSLVRNLLENGIKFTQEGTVTISSRRLKDSLKIEVKDTGIGIRKKDHKYLFRSFSQLDENVEGLGVGLAMVRRIVNLHNGKIFIDSKFGKGSKFTVIFPK